MTDFKMPTLEETVARMKAEILADIANGTVPQSIKNFSELHDYVDANCYGGFCDDEYMSKMWAHFGCGPDDGCPEEVYVLDNAAQNAVNIWLHETYVEWIGDTSLPRFPIEVVPMYYIQEQAPAGNWVDTTGFTTVERALSHAEYLRHYLRHLYAPRVVRVVVRVNHIIG